MSSSSSAAATAASTPANPRSRVILASLIGTTIEIGDLFEINNIKIGVKLLVAIIITVLVFVYRKKDPAPSWALWTVGTLTFANIVIAVAWR